MGAAMNFAALLDTVAHDSATAMRAGWRHSVNGTAEVLLQGIRGISDLMTVYGLIDLDFAEVRSIMAEMGMAMMGGRVRRATTARSKRRSARFRARSWRKSPYSFAKERMPRVLLRSLCVPIESRSGLKLEWLLRSIEGCRG
jgi:hypothetical protein